MKPASLEYVSDRLIQMRRRIEGARHGGLVLSSEDAEAFVGELSQAIEASKTLENAYSRAEWNRRAGIDVRTLLTDQAQEILDAMRPGGNVVVFRPPTHS